MIHGSPDTDRMPARRVWWGWAFAVCLVACADDSGGGSGSGGTFGTGTGGPATTTTGGGAPSACVDNQQGNDTPQTAHALSFAANGGGLAFGGQVCPQESDWFALEAGCAGYFRVELRCKDLTGGTPSGPNSRCDDGALDLELWRDTGVGLESVKRSEGSFAMEVVPASIDAGRWLVEVRHASGSTIDYTLTTTYLPTGSCVSSAWICEADAQEIDATEASCEILPSGPSCPSGDVYTQPVAMPEVFDGTAWAPGFTIHAAPHEVRNPHHLTTTEHALLENRCIEACEAHWSTISEITANCGVDSFTDIVLRDLPSIASRALIPAELEDGAGVFSGQGGVSFSLHDASAAFASNLHPFRPGRVQPGPESDQQGFHEQYVFDLSGSTVTLTGAEEKVSLSGIARFSDADEKAGLPQVVYLGDLSFASQSGVALELACSDSSSASPTIDAFGFFLTQPAFGVRFSDTSTIGFPPGSLVYRVGLSIDSELTWIDGVNRVNTYGEATPAGVALELTEVLRLPCGSGTTDLTAEVHLADTSTLAHPPEITLDLPDWISCPSWIVIDEAADVTDPQDDVESVKWYANGHLLAPAVTQVFGGHTVFAVVACDSRGGCTRAEHTVQCIPVSP